MQICVAQTNPVTGSVEANIERHIALIELVQNAGAKAIFFPELSLTGYEPALANELALAPDDSRLNVFQQLSDRSNVVIGVGVPTRASEGTRITMLIFRKGQPRLPYSKQILHEDELPFFIEGNSQTIIDIDGCSIAPAICYESLQDAHAEQALKDAARVYLASVAKPERSLAKAFAHYPEIARKYGVQVLMSNAIGYCDNFLSAGNSSAWKRNGELAGRLDGTRQGALLFDTDTEESYAIQL